MFLLSFSPSSTTPFARVRLERLVVVVVGVLQLALQFGAPEHLVFGVR